MAKCKWCGNGGLFSGVSPMGLCPKCDWRILMDINDRLRIVQDSIRIHQTSENIDTAVARFDLYMKNEEHLYHYELKGIRTSTTPPSVHLQDRQAKRDKCIVDALDRQLKKTATAILELKTPKARSNRVAILADKVEEYKRQLSNPALLRKVEEKLERLAKQAEA